MVLRHRLILGMLALFAVMWQACGDGATATIPLEPTPTSPATPDATVTPPPTTTPEAPGLPAPTATPEATAQILANLQNCDKIWRTPDDAYLMKVKTLTAAVKDLIENQLLTSAAPVQTAAQPYQPPVQQQVAAPVHQQAAAPLVQQPVAPVQPTAPVATPSAPAPAAAPVIAWCGSLDVCLFCLTCQWDRINSQTLYRVSMIR